MTIAAANLKAERKFVDLLKGEHTGEAYMKINPDHTVPTLVDGPLTLWESRAIMQYLMNKYAPGSDLYPKDPVRRAPVDRLLQYDVSTLFPPIRAYMVPQLFQQKEADPEKEAEVKKVLDYVDKLLAKQTYVAATHLTIADLSMDGSISFLDAKAWNFGSWPNIVAWRGRLRAEPWHAEANKGLKEFLQS